MPMPEPPERFLASTGVAAQRLGVTQRTIVNYISAGRLAGYRLPTGALRVDLAEVDALVSRVDPSEVASSNPPRSRTRARREP